ncbi:PAS domain S-box protein [Aerosakkonemataceae cyanobacterium BLCC-F50]|uniref:histidine kinase n=1 Tax=Floridaenema flaviceps BLCC-F50 TaxID=3153642 RepID=A0ABV4Y3F6_9CYAN
MDSRIYRRLFPYVVAIDTTGVALLLTHWLEPLMTRTSSPLFLIAIIVTTWYGGFYPGMLSVVLSVLAIDYFLIPPIYQLSIFTTDDLVRLVIFTLIALLIHFLSNNLKNSKRKVQQLNRILRQETADRLRTALSAAQMGMWDWDLLTGKITWSEEHQRLFGVAPGSFDGRYETFAACLHPEDREGVNRALDESLKNRLPYQHEFRVIWGDGSIHWVEGRGKGFYNEQGQPVRMSGTIMAIDARKKAVETLQATSLQLEQQFEQQRLVLEMTRRIRNSLNLQEILQTTVDEVREYLKTDRVTIFQFTPSWGGTIIVESVADEWMPLLPLQIYDPCIGEDYVQPFIDGLVTAKSDIYNSGISPCHVEFLAQLQVRANLVVPVTKDNKLWGLLAAHHCQGPRQWQDIEINLLRQLAAQVSIALQQSELLEKVQTELAERKQAELAIQESQNQIQRQLTEIETIYQSAPIGLNVLDTELRFVRINQRLAEINGFSIEAHIGRKIHELLPDLADIAQRLLRPILETGEPLLNIEITGETPAQPGVQRIWLESFLPLRDGDRIIGINTVCEDITERKQAEQDLARAALRIQTLFHTSFDGIVTLDRQGNVIDANPRFAQMLGYTPEETAKLNVTDWDALLTREELQQLLDDSIKLKNGVFETRHRRKDGSIYDVEISYSVVQWQKEILRFCVCRDITERKQTQLALQQLNAELEARVTQRSAELADLYNNAPCGYHSLDVDGFIVRINDTELNWLGYTREEVLYKKKYSDLITPGSREIFYQNFPKFKQHGEIDNLEFEIFNKDGTTRWVSLNATAVRDRAGNFIMSRSSLFDISDRKLIEKALRQSEETFRLLSEFSPIGIFLCDIAGKCVYTNPLYQQIVGASSEETLGDRWKEFIHPDDRQWVFQYWSDLVATGNEGVFNELRYQDRQGKVCYTQVRTVPIKSSDGTVILFVGTVEDITERRKIDQMKKEFISVVSHELRTPLTSIRGSLGLIAGGVYDRKPEKMKEMIAIAARQSDRLVRLVNDILDLRRLESGQTNFNLQQLTAAELIQQSVDVMQGQAEESQITLSIIPSVVDVWADGDAIVQTLTNLLSNAIKFSPQNSIITISAKVIPEDLATQKQLPSSALFWVQDQGRGIPEDKRETIFGQFQQVDASDSRERGGTGLGLAICRNIIEQHGSKIWVESVLNEGSTFYFTLPLSS